MSNVPNVLDDLIGDQDRRIVLVATVNDTMAYCCDLVDALNDADVGIAETAQNDLDRVSVGDLVQVFFGMYPDWLA